MRRHLSGYYTLLVFLEYSGQLNADYPNIKIETLWSTNNAPKSKVEIAHNSFQEARTSLLTPLLP